MPSTIPDRAMAQALRENVGAISAARLAKLTSFSWSDYRLEARMPFTAISDLRGIEPCKSLRVFEAHGNSIASLEPLRGLDALESLWIGGSRVRSLAPLAGKTALRELELSDNAIRDLAPLAGCTALEHLVLSNTQIADLAPVAALPKLREVSLWKCKQLDLGAGSRQRGFVLAWLERGVTVHIEDGEALEREARKRSKKGARGATLADAARKRGALLVAQLLESAGVTARDADGLTPLHHACREADSVTGRDPVKDRIGLVKALLAAGADANAESTLEAATPLMHALAYNPKVSLELVRALIEGGADAAKKLDSHRAAVVYAADAKRRDVLALLVEHGVDLGEADALNALCKAGLRDEVAAQLARKVDVDARGKLFGYTPLYAAASARGHLDVVRLLLAHGADPNAKWCGVPVLHSVWEASIATALLDAGAKLEGKSDRGDTPLGEMVSNCYALPAARVLLARGAKAKTANKMGRTPLHRVVDAMREFSEADPSLAMVDLLVAAGGELTAVDKDGKTPAQLANGEHMKKKLRPPRAGAARRK